MNTAFWRGKRVPYIGEWLMYREKIPLATYSKLAARFNPRRFDAAKIVRLAREAGQRYLVITAKHHDGFSLFDSKVSDYDIVDATPFGRDPLAEPYRFYLTAWLRDGAVADLDLGLLAGADDEAAVWNSADGRLVAVDREILVDLDTYQP